MDEGSRTSQPPDPALPRATHPWRWPTIIGFVGTSLYFFSSFIPFSISLGASYPAVDFSLPLNLWLIPIVRDAVLTMLRIGALIVARRSPRSARVAWGALAALGATSLISAVADAVEIIRSRVPGSLGPGAYLYLAGSAMVLAAGILGLRVRERTDRPEASGSSGPGAAPSGGSEPMPALTPVPVSVPLPPHVPARPDLADGDPAVARVQRSARPAWTDPTTTRRSLVIFACLAVLLPLGIAPATARSHDGPPFAFYYRNRDGSPMRWNPCQPIHYIVNLSSAPPGAEGTIREAIREVRAATGLDIVSDGTTSEAPVADGQAREARFPDQPPPVLIAWAKPGPSGIALAGNLGLTIPDPKLLAPGRYGLMSAEVVLNAAVNLPIGFATADAWGPVLLHELGHVIGLGHVGSIHEIMHPGPDFETHYNFGDLEGLKQLGRAGGCFS